MARVTVEDCTAKIPSRFELVVLAAQRAREIAAGGKLTIEKDNDKNPVIALREIAAGTVLPEGLQELLVKKLQKRQLHEDRDLPEEGELMDMRQEIEDEVKTLTGKLSDEDIEELYSDEIEVTDEELQQD